MNLTLFRATLKSNWILLLVFFLVMAMYLAIIISMYDPEGADVLDEMVKTMPDTLVKAMMFESIGTGLTAFLGGYFYGFLVILFPLIYCIILGNGLVARHVDSGSMAYLLSTPISRIKLAITQAVYFLASLVVLFGLITLTGIAVSQLMFPGGLDLEAFLLLNLYAVLLFWAVSGICFFFSCVFGETKYSLGFGAGVPLLFFLIKMLSEVGDGTTWLRNLSLFSLYEAESIVAGDFAALTARLVFIGLTAILYGAGMLVFDRKDLFV
jgi:ABC-2 type transport system permease protein